MNIWRLNVKETQITSCIDNKKFAISYKPKNPEIVKGDILLLQLVVADANRLKKQESRIEYVLMFDYFEEDYNGISSRYYWPNARKTWTWIMHCSDIIPTIHFSLENLDLKRNYAGQSNPVLLAPEDAIKVTPFILRLYKSEEIAKHVHRVLEQAPFQRDYRIWSLIQGNDRIVEANPDSIRWETVPEHKQITRNSELPVILKELYNYKCQVCEHDFKPTYGIPYSETHHIIWLARGGVDHSNNLIVVCPNHHRIIHEAKPKFDRNNFKYIYPNGYQESLILKDHLKKADLMLKIEKWAKERYDDIQKEKVTLDE